MSELFVDTGSLSSTATYWRISSSEPDGMWHKPSLVLSGRSARDINLNELFDISHVGRDVAQASALKMSFASFTKVLFFMHVSETRA